MAMILKNNTVSDITLLGRVIPGSGQYTIDPANRESFAGSDDLWTKVADGDLTVNDGSIDLSLSEGIDHLKNYQQKTVTTEDNRLMIAENRIPAGYTLYIAGESDDISAGTHGGGDKLIFNSSTTQVDFRQLDHFYVIGARCIWEGCDLTNYFDAKMVAPATTGATETTGDFNKYNLGGSLNMFIPTAAGTGSWDMDITATYTNTEILKCTPVPVSGNNGYFDYNSDTNVLSVNSGGTGGYNLYDFDADLHVFARKAWGKKGDGNESSLDITGLVGKLLFKNWLIRFNFYKDGGSLSSEKAGIQLILGAMGNT